MIEEVTYDIFSFNKSDKYHYDVSPLEWEIFKLNNFKKLSKKVTISNFSNHTNNL